MTESYQDALRKVSDDATARNPAVQATRSLKRPLLKAEDGSKFYGRVDAIQDGLWRAACHAMQDQGGSTLMEQPDSQVFATKAEGRAWIMELGARRGFRTWVNETPDEGHTPA